MSPAKPCGSLPNWEGATIQGVLSIPYATGLCVCSKSRYLNRVCGFVFLIYMLTLRGEHFVHPFVFSISLVMGVANRDSLKRCHSGKVLMFVFLGYYTFQKSSNVPMFQCSRALSLSVRRRGRIFKRKDERQFFKFYLSFKRVAHIYYNKYII